MKSTRCKIWFEKYFNDVTQSTTVLKTKFRVRYRLQIVLCWHWSDDKHIHSPERKVIRLVMNVMMFVNIRFHWETFDIPPSLFPTGYRLSGWSTSCWRRPGDTSPCPKPGSLRDIWNREIFQFSNMLFKKHA